MMIDFYLISGMMLGFEYVPYQEDGFNHGIVIDIFVLRIMFLW